MNGVVQVNWLIIIQLREREMIVKLASALGISREDLKKELRNSMSGDYITLILF